MQGVRSGSSHAATAGRILILAAAYFVAGRAALFLAIPPGYATAVWPASGIALAALLAWGFRVWPGVFLGSFLLNLPTSLAAGPWNASILCGLIGSGAALQALAGAWLVRRFAGFPNRLDQQGPVAAFVVLGGPVSCLVSSTTGVGALLGRGVIQGDQAFESWMLWWMGDSIGVLLVAPVLVLGSLPELREDRRRNVRAAFSFASLGALVCMLIALAGVAEERRIRSAFSDRVRELQVSLDRTIRRHLSILEAVAAFRRSNPRGGREQFSQFVRDLVSGNHGVRAIEWAPAVPRADLESFVEGARHDGLTEFKVWSAAGALSGPEAAPVLYIEPMEGNRTALGYDLASEPLRREALVRARETGRAAATSALRLVQDHGGGRGLLAVHPVGASGWIVGVFQVDALVEAAQPPVGVSLRLKDDGTVIHGGAAPEPAFSAPQEVVPLEVAGRRWDLEIAALPSLPLARRTGHVWMLLAGALAVSCLAVPFLLVVTGHPALVEKSVVERTAELSAANAKLAAEIVERHRAEETLRRSEQAQRTLVDCAPEAILILDPVKGHFVDANPKAVELLRHPREELLGMSPVQVSPGKQPDGRDSAEQFRQCVEQVSRGVQASFEWTCLTAAGGQVPCEVHLVRLPGGLIRGSILDITERKRTDRMKDEFVSTVSHELRTPLTAVRGALGLMAGGALGPLPPKAMEMAQMATKNIERLVRLISDILDLHKIESGRLEIQRVPVEIETLVRQSVEECRSYARPLGVDLEVGGSLGDPVVLADPDRLTQVVANLVSNASKFSPSGETVRVHLERRDGFLRVSVADRGPGIPEEFRPRLFQKFSQVDASDSRKRGGTGLGLSICKALVERMGGTLGYLPNPGGGSVFWFELEEWAPRGAVAAGEALVPASG